MKVKTKSFISLLLSAIFLLSVFPAVNAAPQKVDASDSPLTVQITTDKSSYSTFGMAMVDISVTNNSSEVINDINVENVLPEQLSAFGNESLSASYNSLKPGDSITISYRACLDPNKAPVNFLVKLLLKLKIYFMAVYGDIYYAPTSDVAVINNDIFSSFNFTKDIAFGKITVTDLVKVSYLLLPAGTSTGTTEDIVSLYNTAANATKAYIDQLFVKKSYGVSTDIDSGIGTIGSLMGNLFNGYDPTVESGTFISGISGEITLKDFLPPSGNEKMSTLPAEGVKSASCIMLGSSKLIVINLVSEQVSAPHPIPPYHSTCMDVWDLLYEDLSPFSVETEEITYTGATIIAIINESGYLNYLNINEPIQIKATMSYDDMPNITFEMLDVFKQSISFEY